MITQCEQTYTCTRACTQHTVPVWSRSTRWMMFRKDDLAIRSRQLFIPRTSTRKNETSSLHLKCWNRTNKEEVEELWWRISIVQFCSFQTDNLYALALWEIECDRGGTDRELTAELNITRWQHIKCPFLSRIVMRWAKNDKKSHSNQNKPKHALPLTGGTRGWTDAYPTTVQPLQSCTTIACHYPHWAMYRNSKSARCPSPGGMYVLIAVILLAVTPFWHFDGRSNSYRLVVQGATNTERMD